MQAEVIRAMARRFAARLNSLPRCPISAISTPTRSWPRRAAVWRAILDFEARVGEVSGIQSVERYDVTDTGLGATWKLKMMGIGASFSMKYTLAPADHFLYYTLDPARPGDLKAGAGSYQLVRVGDGTRVVYRSKIKSNTPIPTFVKQ